jgi:hypothetical protein
MPLSFAQLNPKSLLQRGWFAVIFSALKKNVEFNDKLNLYKCLDICLKAQNLDPDDPSQWNQVSYFLELFKMTKDL